MRILVTTPYPMWPESAGAPRRTLGVGRALAALGHQVTLLSRGDPPPAEAIGGIDVAVGYPGRGRIAHFVNPAFTRALGAALDRSPDLVVTEAPYQAPALLRLCTRRGAPLVFDSHNVEAERFRSLGRPLIARLVESRERRLVRRARGVLAVSAEDREAFARLYGTETRLLPNGVDTDVFTPGPADPALLEQHRLAGKPVVLFCGSFDYSPNRAAVDFLLTRDWSDAHLVVVGRRPPERFSGRPGVTVTGEVLNVVPWLRRANLVVAPLDSGGGTRLKIVEALACAQEVLSTAFGAAGLNDGDVPGLHLAERDSFFDRLDALLEDPPEPGRNRAGADFAQGKSWRRLVAAIDWTEFARSTAS